MGKHAPNDDVAFFDFDHLSGGSCREILTDGNANSLQISQHNMLPYFIHTQQWPFNSRGVTVGCKQDD